MAILYRCNTPTDLLCPREQGAPTLRAAGIEFHQEVRLGLHLAAPDWAAASGGGPTRLEGAPRDRVVRGPASVMRLIAAWFSTWRAYEVIVESYEPAAAGFFFLMKPPPPELYPLPGPDALRL